MRGETSSRNCWKTSSRLWYSTQKFHDWEPPHQHKIYITFYSNTSTLALRLSSSRILFSSCLISVVWFFYCTFCTSIIRGSLRARTSRMKATAFVRNWNKGTVRNSKMCPLGDSLVKATTVTPKVTVTEMPLAQLLQQLYVLQKFTPATVTIMERSPVQRVRPGDM